MKKKRFLVVIKCERTLLVSKCTLWGWKMRVWSAWPREDKVLKENQPDDSILKHFLFLLIEEKKLKATNTMSFEA